jgi:NADH-quinone oxidoreductase subunit I
MNGLGIIRGLVITFKHFVGTYLEDLRAGRKRYNTPEGIKSRSNADTKGIFTVQYPEEKIPVPEAFRYLPFLVYQENADGGRDYRCTACGICSKVCPPQCIWIVRKVDPVTNKPITSPSEFFIDVDICMNCGFCAEYCPFDAIKMDHDYEIASYDRMKASIYNKEQLGRSTGYYQQIRPTYFAREEKARAETAKRKAEAQAGQN